MSSFYFSRKLIGLVARDWLESTSKGVLRLIGKLPLTFELRKWHSFEVGEKLNERRAGVFPVRPFAHWAFFVRQFCAEYRKVDSAFAFPFDAVESIRFRQCDLTWRAGHTRLPLELQRNGVARMLAREVVCESKIAAFLGAYLPVLQGFGLSLLIQRIKRGATSKAAHRNDCKAHNDLFLHSRHHKQPRLMQSRLGFRRFEKR